MTENEAIKRMKYRIKTATDIAGKGVDGKAYEDMEMAIQALEKQIQKKPIKIAPCKYVNHFKCSVCGEFLSINKPFCGECGNAVDWRE